MVETSNGAFSQSNDYTNSTLKWQNSNESQLLGLDTVANIYHN